jgi:c-di-GMP phosphodiesterase
MYQEGSFPVAGDGLPSDVYVGRQAIFDSRRRVMGYELLYRRGTDNWASIDDPVAATSAVVSAAILGFGLDHLVRDGLAFVNVTRDFLAAGLYRLLPAERVVLEILEQEVVNDELVDLLGGVRAEGYRLALDDYVPGSAARRLVGLAEIVKVDLMATPHGSLSDLVADLRSQGAVVLAEKVETPADLQLVREIGIEFLQGFFFQRPEVLSGRTVSIGQLPAVRLLGSVDRAEVSTAELESIIACEPGLAYRLLRLSNSPAVGVSRPVTSLRDALVLLGRHTVKNLALVAMIHGVDGKTSELAGTAIVRAKMCEELAARIAPTSAPAAFLVGLLSVLDALFDAPIAGLVDQLALSDEIATALVDHVGQLGELLDVAIAYERGAQPSVARPDLPAETRLDAYATAVSWADSTMTQLATLDERDLQRA